MTPPAIHRARAEHGPALTALAHRAKRHWGYPEAWIREWRDELEIGVELIEGEEVWMVPGTLDRPGEGADPIACVALSDQGDGLFELEHMWVDPGAHGRGLGRLLFEHVARRARQRGGRELRILSDPNAADFYRHLGCEPAGEHHGEILGEPRVLPILRYGL
jgi:GNAT superfamily N-acetyltransferase